MARVRIGNNKAKQPKKGQNEPEDIFYEKPRLCHLVCYDGKVFHVEPRKEEDVKEEELNNN